MLTLVCGAECRKCGLVSRPAYKARQDHTLLKISQCSPDPENPNGPCLRCCKLSRPTLSRQPCYRYKIADASLYRKQSQPWQEWTTRWNSMEIKDITEWVSPHIKTIEVTHGFGNARYRLNVREFKLMPGDKRVEPWSDGRGNLNTHEIPPYAIVDMRKAAAELRRYMEESIEDFVDANVHKSDPLLRTTYNAALEWAKNAPASHVRMCILTMIVILMVHLARR